MEQTEAASIRDNEEPEKKQKSRRPPSTLDVGYSGQDIAHCWE